MSDFWETNAKNWANALDSNAIASRAITNPAIIAEVIGRKPRSVLDVGCGEGWMAKEFLSRGIDYFGIDGSGPLIEIANSRHGKYFQTVHYDELASGNWRAPKRFDAAVFNFSLLDEKLAPILGSISSQLNPEGRLIIQTLHPCFALKTYRSGWNVEDFKTMSTPFQGTMPWFGRTLSGWSTLFLESGLTLEQITEPTSEAGPLSIIFTLHCPKRTP